MNLKEWRESEEHHINCNAYAELLWCCLDYIPDEFAKQLQVRFMWTQDINKPNTLELSWVKETK